MTWEEWFKKWMELRLAELKAQTEMRSAQQAEMLASIEFSKKLDAHHAAKNDLEIHAKQEPPRIPNWSQEVKP